MRNGQRWAVFVVALFFGALAFGVVMGSGGSSPALAQVIPTTEPPLVPGTFVVDQDADEAPDPGNQCTSAPGDCSLRQAVDAAVDGNTIVFAPTIDPVLSLGDIVVTEDLTIDGEGGETDLEPNPNFPGTRIDAAHTSRIFDIAPGADVVVTDVILQRGQAPHGGFESGDNDGGAVRNAGTLRLERVTVTNSFAGDGAAFSSAGDGGGIWSSGSLTLDDVSFSNVIAVADTGPNRAGNGGLGFGGVGIDGGNGGAVFSSGSLNVSRTFFEGNAGGAGGPGSPPGAQGAGGAVAITGGTASIVNSTFSGNTARDGSAAWVVGGASLTMTSVTAIAGTSVPGGGAVAVHGADGSSAVIVASVFEDDTPSGIGSGDTCAIGSPITAGPDTFVWPPDSSCPATVTTAETWTLPIGASFNGGFARSVRLFPTSPAMDAIPAPGGVCSLGAQSDQRGITRPRGPACDAGAFEANVDFFIGFSPNTPDVTVTFADGVERDVPVHAGNNGTRGATDVQVQLTFPAEVTVHSVTPPDGTSYDTTTGVWTIGDIPAGTFDLPPLVLRLSRNAPGDHVVTATITGDDPAATEAATLTVHEPADRYAVPGGLDEGECLTLATGCAIEYAVEQAAKETETIYVAPGEHVLAPGASLGVTNKSIVGLDPTDRPTIQADAPGMLTTSGTVRFADLDFVNSDAGLSTSGAANATLERVSVRAARRALFTGSGSLTIRDSVLEAVGGSPSGQPFHHALVLATAATVENVTVIGRGTGAVLARTSGQTHTLTNVIARDLGGNLDVAAEAGVTVDLSFSNYDTTGGAGTVTPAGTGGNQTAAPVFVDADGHDFHQAAGSPTVDAGTGTPAAERRDVDYGPRVFGTSVDIGGDELGPILRVTPASHDYGLVAGGSTASQTFTVTNTGTAPLSVTSFTLTGTDAGQFAITLDDCDLAIAPAASCAVAVQFAPTAAGLKSATLEVTGNGGTDTAELTATGDVAPFAWDGGAGPGDRSWSTAANWSTDVVPGATDTATVPTGFDTSTGPVVGDDAVVGALQLASPLHVEAGDTLTLKADDGASSLDAPVSGAGTLRNDGTLVLHAGAGWSGPTLVNTGAVENLAAPAGVTFGPLVNSGVVSQGAAATASFGIGPASGAGTYSADAAFDAPLVFRGVGNELPAGSSLTGEGVVEVAQGATMTAADGTIAIGSGFLSGLRVRGELTVAGAASAPGIDVAGGELHLDGVTLTTAGVVVGGGRLDGDGTITGSLASYGGVVAPTGTITAQSYQAFHGEPIFVPAPSRLEIDAASATEFDRVVATGDIALDGVELDVTQAPGYTPFGGDVLRFLSGGTLTGTFASVSGAAPFDVRYDATGAELYIADVTGPEITATITPAVPASGWHTTSVTVTWSVVDGESPVTSTTGCDPATISTDGTHPLTCSATSAGGTSSNSVTIKRDATKPTIAVTRTPAGPDGANGWYVTAPTITFVCTDATSGVATCPAPVTLGSSASPQTVTGQAVDVAGNQRAVSSPVMKVDLVDPTVTCSTPAPTFVVGQAPAAVSATVTDAHSGPVAGTVSSPATTTSTGSFTVAVTGSDNAGRSTMVQCPYVVARVATKLVATPLVTPGLLVSTARPSAVLTRLDTGAPIAGQPVTLSLHRGPSCTAVTDANGRATCGTVIVILNLFGGGPYTASYAGNATYEPSSAAGTIP